MNRKHNPFVSLLALALMAIIIVSVLLCCKAEEPAQETTYELPEVYTGERFSINFETEDISAARQITVFIITDNKTGNEYLFCTGPNSGGLCLLEELP